MGQKVLRSIFENAPKESETPNPSCTQNVRPNGTGTLPNCAYLANPFVPFQKTDAQNYLPEKGLIRGTLFPGLDLPFLGSVNEKEKGDQGLAELQALGFAINELSLYLDTHEDDREAAELMQSYSELYQSGAKAWEEAHGPLKQMDAVRNCEFLWSKGPWPWEFAANEEG